MSPLFDLYMTLMDACDNREGSWKVRRKVERSKNYELWRSLWFELFWLCVWRSFIEWWFMIACWSFGEWQADRRGVRGHVEVNEWLAVAHQVYVLVLVGHEKKSPVVQDHTVYLLQCRTKNRCNKWKWLFFVEIIHQLSGLQQEMLTRLRQKREQRYSHDGFESSRDKRKNILEKMRNNMCKGTVQPWTVLVWGAQIWQYQTESCLPPLRYNGTRRHLACGTQSTTSSIHYVQRRQTVLPATLAKLWTHTMTICIFDFAFSVLRLHSVNCGAVPCHSSDSHRSHLCTER